MATTQVNLSLTAHHPDQVPFYRNLSRILSTTDHREIGILYIAFAFTNFILAGLFALLIRFTLAGITVPFISINQSTYTSLFTTHGTAMIFLFILPMGVGFGNYFVPIMIGAEDMYWPKWNNIAFYMLIPAAIFIWLGFAGVGWTGYPPLSIGQTASNPISLSPAGDPDFWILGMLVAGTSSIIGAINFALTIWKLRAPGVKFSNMNLFVWATFINSILQVIATPVLTLGLVLLLLDRNLGTSFFTATYPGDPLLWQHVFWFYSHPAVYMMVLPAFGLISNIIPTFSRNKIFGYTSMVAALAVIAGLGLVVWGHHMYVAGLTSLQTLSFAVLTYAIALPSGVKVFNWIFTMLNGYVKYSLPMMWAMAFLVFFLLAGLTGVMLNVVPMDIILHDTYWVVGHFHFMVFGGTVSAVFGAFYYYFPYVTGRKLNEWMGWAHYWFNTVGLFLTFTSMVISGFLGQDRRYYRPPGEYLMWNQIATFGAVLIGIASIFFFVNVGLTMLKRPTAIDDPWGLELGKFSSEPTETIAD